MEFYSTCRLALGREKVMAQVDGEKEFVGQNINIQCVKSKLTKPFKECKLRMAFDEAGVAKFDKEFSLVEALAAAGKLPEPRKGFVEWDGKQYAKKAMAEKARNEGLVPALNALFTS